MSASVKISIGILLIFATGVIVGSLVFSLIDSRQSAHEDRTSQPVRQAEGYRYINPLLECEVAGNTIDARKQNFRDDLAREIEVIKQRHELTEAAVYFRDLSNGPSFGVDADGEFFPASLLKVPLMMAYYRWAEQVPGLLVERILFEAPQDFGVSVTIQPLEVLVPGTAYTVEELIQHMIQYSDNQAAYLLAQRLPQEKMIDFFKIVGVGDDVIKDGRAKLTVKEYASFFRILFNSSYLSQESSEKALALLDATEYNDALPAGVPQGVTVSHKFGEAGIDTTERQLHDCGIVYFTSHPYLACIMTRGKEFDGLKQSIVDISRFIYQKIDEQY